MAAAPAPKILFLQTGGTIDKDYPRTKNGFNFEIGNSAVESILNKIRPSVGFNHEIVTVCRKDSQHMCLEDRIKLVQIIENTDYEKIIITHGTDTIIETGQFLESCEIPGKTLVLTGSFLPEKFRNSDADFNIGLAIGAALSCLESQVLLAMNGLLIRPSQCARKDDGTFYSKS